MLPHPSLEPRIYAPARFPFPLHSPCFLPSSPLSLLCILVPVSLTFDPMTYDLQDQAQLAHVVECLRRGCQDLDAEAFHHLVLTARSIAVVRPANLVKFAEQECSHVLQKCTQTGDAVFSFFS